MESKAQCHEKRLSIKAVLDFQWIVISDMQNDGMAIDLIRIILCGHLWGG